jgi:hypothetical protein
LDFLLLELTDRKLLFRAANIQRYTGEKELGFGLTKHGWTLAGRSWLVNGLFLAAHEHLLRPRQIPIPSLRRAVF